LRAVDLAVCLTAGAAMLVALEATKARHRRTTVHDRVTAR
jgi:hypothetical protein